MGVDVGLLFGRLAPLGVLMMMRDVVKGLKSQVMREAGAQGFGRWCGVPSDSILPLMGLRQPTGTIFSTSLCHTGIAMCVLASSL